MSLEDELDSLASEIEALAERLADRSIELLHSALRDPAATAGAATERVVTRARRALEKAASLLRDAPRDRAE
ncbi:MAG TPA: hypothetical protein VKT18_05455 [Acidimicrobiales bacterium]|nr:hypothetical protein [Acidimicrobiales bacterium]